MLAKQRKNYKGRNRWQPERMPVWLYRLGTAIGDAISYVLISAAMRPRLFVAACIDNITISNGIIPAKEKALWGCDE